MGLTQPSTLSMQDQPARSGRCNLPSLHPVNDFGRIVRTNIWSH
jgi:hypothetical protein